MKSLAAEFTSDGQCRFGAGGMNDIQKLSNRFKVKKLSNQFVQRRLFTWIKSRPKC